MRTGWTAFIGDRKLASGAPLEVALLVRAAIERDAQAVVLLFDDGTGGTVDLPLGVSEEDLVARLGAASGPAQRAPGRPRLGVVAREVTLLPRHWDWLSRQPGGASVTLRKLVDAARKADPGLERTRAAQAAADRFMATIAGDRPGYEEASRALYAGAAARFDAMTAAWPEDVRAHAAHLAADAFTDGRAPAE
jgi:hypothetical protein